MPGKTPVQGKDLRIFIIPLYNQYLTVFDNWHINSCLLLVENPLGLSWHDSAWIPVLNPSNIMDYFSERSNPFYDRTCNNEIVKMQRLNPDQLT